jgi:hypothetical protein
MVCGLLTGMAKATGVGLPVAFGALCALGVMGLCVGALLGLVAGLVRWWLCK